MSTNIFTHRAFLWLWFLYYIYMMLNGVVLPKGSFFNLAFNGVIFLFCIGYSLKNPYLLIKFGFVYLYLLFLFLLLLLTSSNFYGSLRMWMKFSIGYMCLPIGYDLFCYNKSIKNLWVLLKSFLCLFLFNYVISNLLRLGSQYNSGATGVESGNLFDDAMHTNLCVFTLIPGMICAIKERRIAWIVLFVSFICVVTVLMMKRMPIFCMAIAFIGFIVLWQYLKRKFGPVESIFSILPKKYFWGGLGAIAIFVAFYSQSIVLQYQARLDRFEAGIEQESRTRELQLIYQDIVYSKIDTHFFLGKETFNTVGTYANGLFGNRMIHENYGILLNGTGVIGTSFYILLNLYLLVLFYKSIKGHCFTDNTTSYCFYIAYLLCWLMFTLASFSGTIWLLLYPAINYTILGMILRYFDEDGETLNEIV